MTTPDRQPAILLPAAVLAALWALACCWISWQRWYNFEIGVDTAMWAQTLANGMAGRGWQYTCYPDVPSLVPRSLYSMHFYHYLWPVSLLYRVAPHPLVLYFAQHSAHAIGAIFVALLAFRMSGQDRAFALLMMVVFILHPAHARGQVAYDVNPRHISLLWVPLAAWAADTGRRPLVLASLVALAAGEENLALLAGFMCGTFILLHRFDAWRWSLAGVALCAYTGVVLAVGLPAFLRDGFVVHFAGRYAHLWQGPTDWISMLFTEANAIYVAALVGPLLLLPLQPGAWWVAALPFAAQNLLTEWTNNRMIGHHYTTPLAAVLFMGALTVAARQSVFMRRALAGLMVGVCLALGMTCYPSIPYLWEGVDSRQAESGANLRPLAEAIPATDSVSAPPTICAHLWNREGLWFFPQGRNEADWVVFPKYLSGYPAYDEESLRGWWVAMLANPRYRKIKDTADACLFQRIAPSP